MDWCAFNPDEREGGGLSTGGRINVDSGVLNPRGHAEGIDARSARRWLTRGAFFMAFFKGRPERDYSGYHICLTPRTETVPVGILSRDARPMQGSVGKLPLPRDD